MNEENPASHPIAGGRWSPPAPEHMQAMLPQYDEWSLLGCGGMGAVYKARQTSLDRLVAIKVLPPEAAADEAEFIERFKNEARTMARLNHAAIVAVYDFGATEDGLLYFVMEFIDGTDVAKMMQAQGRLPPEYALAITAHVCDALAYAHEHGVIHRDIKPANILINMEGAVKVADFGLARMQEPGQTSSLTRSGLTMGTPDFVAPESLVLGAEVDGRADLYAVGVMLYNMLTGEIPRGFFQLPSEKTGCDTRFDAIIRRAMEQDVARRYQSSRELRRDLDRILTVPIAKEKPPAQRPAGMPARPRHTPQQPPPKSAPWGLIAAAVVVLGGAAFFFMKRGGDAPPPKSAETAPNTPAKPQTAPEPPMAAEPKKDAPAPVGVTTNPNAPQGSPLSSYPVLSHAGHHYQLVERHMSFTSAVKHAESVGGHLLTITSAEEMAWVDVTMKPFIKQTRSGNAGTGGVREEDGVYKWVTGEPFEYTRWYDPTAPTHDPQNKFVLKLTAGDEPELQWGNGHLDAGRAYIIEWDSTPPKTAPAPMVAPVVPSPAPAAVVESEAVRQLRELETSFRAALERDVLSKHREKFTDLNTKYLAALERALAAATAASNLPEALALRDEKQRIESNGPLPAEDAPDMPASLRTLRATYRATLQPIELERHNGRITLFLKYEEVLKNKQAELTKAGRLDDAARAAARLVEIARERTGGVLVEAKELVPDGRELALQRGARFTSAESFKPPVEFTIVAKTQRHDLRLAYTAKQIIFNWETRPDELRIDGDPGGARHAPGKGRIPEDAFVTIHWRIMPHMQSISINGERRFLHFGDYSKVDKPLEIFPLNHLVTIQSAKARVLDLAALEDQVSSVPEMKEIFLNKAEWTGKIAIPAGSYRPLRRISIGAPGATNPSANSTNVRCDVTSAPGMRIENTRFHALEGSWKAAGGHFRDVKITADLGGSFEARDSLFQDCQLAKEGPWYVAWFSSKWQFANCVITGGFMQNWKLGDVGMKLDSCTFHDVDFIPVAFKEDAGKEVAMDWLSIQNCRFINCRVPESFALATKNCLFEKCTFGEPEDKLPVKTALNAVIYVQDCLNAPKTGPGRTIEARPAAQLTTKPGAALPYIFAAGRLDFQTPPQ
ncbi:MAG: protein kinase [Verrucomicrobiaceae bacterium]|nr:protein kinase [Verrucomicrobiaceae bacterium]